LVGNPLHASAEKPDELGCEYRIEVLKRVPQLVKLDGIPWTWTSATRRRRRWRNRRSESRWICCNTLAFAVNEARAFFRVVLA